LVITKKSKAEQNKVKLTQLVLPGMQVIKGTTSAADLRKQQAAIAEALRAKTRKNKTIRNAQLRRIESGDVGPITKAYIAAGKRFPGQAGYVKGRSFTPSFAPVQGEAIIRAYLGLGDTKCYDTIHTGFTPITMLASTDTPVSTSAGNWYYAGLATPSSAILLNPVNQAATASARLGRSIKMNAIHIRGAIQAGAQTAATGAANQQVSLALVYVRDVNNASVLPPQDTVFQSQNALTLTNRDNATNFKIVRKWDYNLVGDRDAAGDRTSNSSVMVNEYVQLRGLETTWTASVQTGGYDSMEKGGLILYIRGCTPSATNSQVFAVTTRLYFADM